MKLFRMNPNENIHSLQKRFTHIVNHLASLGKTFPNEDLINKVLRCLSREWQPKVTAISESKDLSSMSLATLLANCRNMKWNFNVSTKMKRPTKEKEA